jgi:hypothetical protein
MLQTYEDLLSDKYYTSEKLGIWLRVALELPKNLVEEHVNNIRGKGMKNSTSNNKKVILAAGIAGLVLVCVILFNILSGSNQYKPTTLSKVPHAVQPPVCIQTKENEDLSVKKEDENFLGNMVASSIIDVPAGTNVDAYLSSYNGTNATGTAVYSDKFGSYNFTAKKASNGSNDSYLGGWKITHFEACKA